MRGALARGFGNLRLMRRLLPGILVSDPPHLILLTSIARRDRTLARFAILHGIGLWSGVLPRR